MDIKIQSFEMQKSEGPVQIRIAYEEDNLHEEVFINVYLYDETQNLRVQALFRGEPITCMLSEEYASLGCIKGDITGGVWQAILLSEKEIPSLKYIIGPYRLDHQVEDTEKTDPILKTGETWYRGDFHTHTLLSDGCISLEEVPEILKKNKLDFVFLTDHNMIHPYFTKYHHIFSGTELTLSIGHMNFHGIKEVPFKSFKKFTELLAQGVSDPIVIIDSIQASHLSVNHPFMKPWEYSYGEMPLDKIDSLEIICDPTWHTASKANDLALKFIQFLWSQGHKITAIGGSDAHLPYGVCYEGASSPSWYGDPATCVYAKALTEDEILKGVKRGAVYVARSLTLDIVINEGNNFVGDVLKERELVYKIGSSDLKKTVYVYLIINEEKICCEPLACGNFLIFHLNLEEGYKSISIEVRNDKKELVGCVNPIYYGTKEAAFTTWQQAIGAFCIQEGVHL